MGLAMGEWVMQNKFNADGFVVTNNIVSMNDIISARQDIEEIFANTGQNMFDLYQHDRQLFINCCKICHDLPSIWQMGSNPAMIKFVQNLGLKQPVITMKPVLLFSCESLASDEFYWKALPHQEWFATRGSLNSIVVWIPLCDIQQKLGYLEIVPNSHTIGLLEHEIKEPAIRITDEHLQNITFQPIPMCYGQILAFSSFLIHRSGVNQKTNEVRLTVSYRFDDATDPTFLKRGYFRPFNYNRVPHDEFIP